MTARIGPIWVILAASLMSAALSAASASERPPRNPFLADSVYPLGHGDSAQQDALSVRGPNDLGPSLEADEIQYAPVGPAHFGAYTSSPYIDGRRVIWSNGLERLLPASMRSQGRDVGWYRRGVRR